MLKKKDVAGLERIARDSGINGWNQETRVKAIEALIELGATPALISSMNDMGNTLAMTSYLTRMCDPAMLGGEVNFQLLLDALNNGNTFVEAGAALILNKIGDVRAVDPIIERLQDPTCSSKRYMVLALGGFPISKVRAALNRAVKDPDSLVSGVAKDTLAKLSKG